VPHQTTFALLGMTPIGSIGRAKQTSSRRVINRQIVVSRIAKHRWRTADAPDWIHLTRTEET
jgi:hypothetical protein